MPYCVNNYRDIIDQGIARTVSQDVCKLFDSYISQNYAWVMTGYRIDWKKHPDCKRFNWLRSSDEETSIFLKNSCLSAYKKICVIYAANEPGLIVDFQYARDNLDLLTYCSCGVSFLVGISNETSDNEFPTLIHHCFLEVDLSYWITEAPQ